MVVSALVSLLIVAAPIPEGWSTYGNERYGIPRRPDLVFAVLAKPLARSI